MAKLEYPINSAITDMEGEEMNTIRVKSFPDLTHAEMVRFFFRLGLKTFKRHPGRIMMDAVDPSED